MANTLRCKGGIARAIQQTSEDELLVEHGANATFDDD
jgi:hypothetical protein